MQRPHHSSYLLVVRRALQDGGKRDMRQGPEELMRRQATTDDPTALDAR